MSGDDSMKICLYDVPGVPLGKHNVKDPRVDQVDKLVEAKKKVYVQVDVVDKESAHDSDAIVVSNQQLPDLILSDLEFIEMRLGREPEAAERALLEKLRTHLEKEQLIVNAGLNDAEKQIIASYNFYTKRPVIVGSAESLIQPDELILKAYQGAGYFSFLTVGGKENRAWAIAQGTTAWEAAGVIHTDIQKGFIRAEIISFADLIQAGGETQAKRAGKMRLETKQYLVQDCDIVNFRFNK